MIVATRSLARSLMAVVGLAYFSLLVLLLVLNHMSPAVVLVMTLAACTLVVIALRPYLGLHAFIMLLFVESAFASRQGITAMKIIGIIIFCGWLLSMGVRRQVPLRFDPLTLTILLFLAWSLVTLLYAIDVEIGIMRTFTYVQLAAASLMFASVLDDPTKLRGILRALVLWSLAATCIAIVGYYLGITPVAVGLAGNRNLLAMYINVGIVCAFLLYQTGSHGPARLGFLLALPFLLHGLAVTYSRTGLLVLGMALLMVWYRTARQRNFGLLLGSVLTICLIALFLPADVYQRAESIVPVIKHREDTFGKRVRLWKAGMRMIEDRPAVGVGPGNFVVAVARYSRGDVVLSGISAHSTYVGVAAEMGLIGLAVFVLVLWFALRAAHRAIRGARDPSSSNLASLAVMAEISLLVVLGAGLTATVGHHKILWLLVGTCAAVGRMAPQRLEGTSSAPALSQRLPIGTVGVQKV